MRAPALVGGSKTLLTIKFLVRDVQDYDEPGVLMIFKKTALRTELETVEGELRRVSHEKQPARPPVKPGNYAST